MKNSICTIAGLVGLGLLKNQGSKAKKLVDRKTQNIFNINSLNPLNQKYNILKKINQDIKRRETLGVEVIGDSKKLVNLLEDESIDAIITSPPYYGVVKYTDSNLEVGFPNRNAIQDEQNKKVKGEIKYVNDIVSIFVNLKSKLKHNGTLWVNLGYKMDSPSIIPLFVAGMLTNGWALTNDITWIKANPMPSGISKRPGKVKTPVETEKILVFKKQESQEFIQHCLLTPTTSEEGREYTDSVARNTKGKTQRKKRKQSKKVSGWKALGTAWPLGNSQPTSSIEKDQDVFEARFINTQYFDKYKEYFKGFSHQAIMNPLVARNCIWASTKPGDVILDPFSGTGTVTLLAKMFGRIGIGFELNTLNALRAVVGKDYPYTSLWKNIKIRDEKDKSDQTTKPLEQTDGAYFMYGKPLRRTDIPFKTEIVDFSEYNFSHNKSKEITISKEDIEKVKKAAERNKILFNLMYPSKSGNNR